jgi:ParB-like chromosome segregation protein Spo0J
MVMVKETKSGDQLTLALRKPTNSRVVYLSPVPGKDIDLGWRARQPGDINTLTRLIGSDGQIQAINVEDTGRKRGPRYRLLSGRRRMAACERLGVPVRAEVHAPRDAEDQIRIQLVENLGRKDFDALELGEMLAAWKAQYEAKHPETVHGRAGRGRSKERLAGKGAVARFTKVAAADLSCSEAKVYEFLAMAALPKRTKSQIDKTDRRARDRLVRQELTGIRRKNRLKRLRERAAAAAPEVVEDPAAQIVIKHQDNRDYFRLAPRKSFDLVLTDAQYELDWSEIAHVERASLNESVLWDKLDLGWLKAVEPLLADDAMIVTFCSVEMVGFYKLAFSAIGFEMKLPQFVGYYVKTNPPPATREGTEVSAVECIVRATRGKPYFKPFENKGGAEAANWFMGPICGGQERLDHPTQKPEWLIRELYERYALPEHTRTLDPFAGTGTTLVVAQAAGGRCTGIEKERHYVDQAILRLKAQTGRDPGRPEAEAGSESEASPEAKAESKAKPKAKRKPKPAKTEKGKNSASAHHASV